MGDAGEGLVDAESRIQERLEELEQERLDARRQAARNPEAERALESLRLARADLERQLAATTHERRRSYIAEAIADLDRKIAETSGGRGSTSA